jgi:hypothetical protein
VTGKVAALLKEALKNYFTRSGVVKFSKKCSFTTCKLGNCSCVALPPASLQSSATAPALLYLLHPCSRRQLLLRCSTSCIRAVVGNCSCVALPPASMQSSATAPALLSISFQMKFYLPHPWGRTSSILAVVGNCSCVTLDFIPDEILHPCSPPLFLENLPSRGRLASASPPTFFRASLK